MRAKGTFEIKAEPQPPYHQEAGISLGRMVFRKDFSGDLIGESTVEVLTARTPVEGSAAYVGIERIVGKLSDLSGSFVVAHLGLMNAGAQRQEIPIVPDSGTDELKGISGRFEIQIEGGKHFYVVEYELPS